LLRVFAKKTKQEQYVIDGDILLFGVYDIYFTAHYVGARNRVRGFRNRLYILQAIAKCRVLRTANGRPYNTHYGL